jgi:putative transposase
MTPDGEESGRNPADTTFRYQPRSGATIIAQGVSPGLAVYGQSEPHRGDTNMAHTYTDLISHIVFSTKDRRASLTKEMKPRLFAYMTGICEKLKSKAYIINGPEDHAHALVSIAPSLSTSEFLEKFKANSSRWVNDEFKGARFAWQPGYAAFTVSRSNFQSVYDYIANQEKHHQKMTFKQELIALLQKHGIEYDERYLWN